MNSTNLSTRQDYIQYMKKEGLWEIVLVASISSGLICFVLNGILLLLFMKNSKLFTLPYLSHIVSDFLISFRLLNVNLILSDASVDWICDVSTIFQVMSSFAFLYNVPFLAFDRLMAVYLANDYTRIMKKKISRAVTPISWVMLTAVPITIRLLRERKGCYQVGQQLSQVIMVAFGSTLLLLGLLIYCLTFVILTRKKKSATRTALSNAFITALIVTLLDIIGWCPQAVVTISKYCLFGDKCGFKNRNVHVFFLIINVPLTSITSAMNACVAMFRSQDIRQGLRSLFCFKRRNRVGIETPRWAEQRAPLKEYGRRGRNLMQSARGAGTNNENMRVETIC